ncbi:TonB-dependent receptor plug domain-containing protein, partial [candidate division GN15 bacterium]|nr:TonB-dependent receptor plug domain-containing protein [candidate division GN15 bacterium]
MKKAARLFALIGVVVMVLTAVVAAQSEKPGTITGIVVDAQTGEALIGVNVFVVGTSMGAQTDVDGRFTVRNVPPGTYALKVSSVGYNTVNVSDAVVTSGKATTLDFTLAPSVLQTDVEINVTAKAVQGTQAALFKDRQASVAVKDAISAEQISKSGAGDAAEATKQIVGATVVEGNRVYIRGLGDRYGNTSLNGTALPSPGNRRGGGVQMELVPTNILDNIVVQKQFTPDKAGDFAGGSVNLQTKDFPEVRTLTFSTSTSHNSVTTGEQVYYMETGSKNWLGYNDGHYDYPSFVDEEAELWEEAEAIPFSNIYVRNSRPGDTVLVNARLAVNEGFNKEMSPKKRTAPWNQSYSASFGDQWQLFERPLGITATLNYSRKFDRKLGVNGDFKNGTPTGYDTKFLFDKDQTQETYGLGGMFSATYSVHTNHKFSFKTVYNRESVTRTYFQIGEYPERANGDLVRDIGMYFSERRLSSTQISGEHSLLGNFVKASWRMSEASTSREDPDVRFFTDEVFFDQGIGEDGNEYVIDVNQFPEPERIFQRLSSSNRDVQADLEFQVSRTTKLKTGAAYKREERNKRLTTFQYRITTDYGKEYSGVGVDGDISEFAEAVGISRVDTTSGGVRYFFQNFFDQTTNDRDQSDGALRVDAWYAMAEFGVPFVTGLRLIGGARHEKTDIWVQDWNLDGGARNQSDWLPSASLVQSVNDRMNVRASFGQTLARPTIRELSPGADKITEEGGRLDPSYVGNPDLEITKIDNYDLRWEWFRRPGEVFAISLFYKDFQNPIELAIIGANGEVQPRNVSEATAYGVEFEFRTRLDVLWEPLSEVTFGGNATFVKAEIAIDEEVELTDIINRWPDASDKRDMFG